MITVTYPIVDLLTCPLISQYSKDILRKCEDRDLLPVVIDLFTEVTNAMQFSIYDLDDEIAYHLEDWLHENDFLKEDEEL